jgi:hypothetical protein
MVSALPACVAAASAWASVLRVSVRASGIVASDATAIDHMAPIQVMPEISH